jgi:uncharacterized protein GlcG (DUF336 family)
MRIVVACDIAFGMVALLQPATAGPFGEKKVLTLEIGFTETQDALPIVVDGEVIGAIGTNFDTPEHDVQIAEAGLAAVPG